MTLLNTTLQIVRGVFKAPGDSFSAENDLFILELQDPQGFSLQVDGWSPNLPALKSGGTWAESNIADGRIPLAQPVGNVMETMRLTMANGDLQQRFAIFKKLGQMRQSVIDFWDGTAQIDPVYIRWFAAIGKGEQFALIYNLEMAQDTDIFNPEQAWDVTLTIERESYWRGIWPGGNPLEWHFQSQGKVRGSAGVTGYDYNDLSLVANTDHLIYSATLNNASEWKAATLGNQSVYLSQNFVTIPAGSVPGDAPALLNLALTNNDENSPIQLFVARSSKPASKIDHNGVTRFQSYTLAGGDATGAGWTKPNVGSTLGLRSNGSDSIYTVAEVSMLTGATSAVLTWGGASSTILLLDRTLLRGSFAVFLRGRVTTGGAVLGDVTTLVFRISECEDASPELESVYNFPQVSIVPHATNQILHYCGRLTLPLNSNTSVSLRGYGQQIRESTSGNLKLEIGLINNSAGTRVTQICDVIFMPIDEWMGGLMSGDNSSSFAATHLIDSTGYFAHGKPETISSRFRTNSASGGTSIELRAPGELTLLPNIEQRLYILCALNGPVQAPTIRSLPNQTFTIRGSIIPRWAGIRDV